jgi:CRISPR system Cascade subunit CasC
MSRFVQLHVLTSYPPANLNRDDLGQPKTARVGGVERLRISSQSLKRAWRTSDVFKTALAGKIGTRTRLLKNYAISALTKAGVAEKDATAWATMIAKSYTHKDLTDRKGKTEKEKEEEGSDKEKKQLVHVSPEEMKSLDNLLALLAAEKRAPKNDEINTLIHEQTAVDIAMFGRMLASKPDHNIEAAVQVAHAIGVHASAIEDDYFTAVEELNEYRNPEDNTGAGYLDQAGFGAALFYLYVCIDREQLKKNLGGDEALTRRALQALAEAVLKVAPTGKQNSFASRAYAHFALAEKGSQQPRSLSLAFLKPVGGADYAAEATGALLRIRENMEKVYGPCADASMRIDALAGEGSAAALAEFVAGE